MLKRLFISMLILMAVTITFGLNEASAGLPPLPPLPPLPGLPGPNVNVHVNGYQPAPPGVHVQIDEGRPYYVERDRRIYIEEERPHKHYKKKKHHKDHGKKHGNKHGHDR